MRRRSRIISSRRTFGSASFRAAGKLIGHPHLFVSKLKARGLLLETGVDPTRLRAPRANQRRVTGRDEDRGPRAQRNSRYAVLRFAHVSGAPEYLKFLLFKNYYFTNNISPHGTSILELATPPPLFDTTTYMRTHIPLPDFPNLSTIRAPSSTRSTIQPFEVTVYHSPLSNL